VFSKLFVSILAFDPLVQVLQWSWLAKVFVMEFLKLLQAAYEIPSKVLYKVKIVAFLAYLIL
jgi:hypothetical protein